MYSKNKYQYTARFCEENIWLLGKSLIAEDCSSADLTVLLLSNAGRQIPLFDQISCEKDFPILWDYHVLLLKTPSSGDAKIFDFDSRLAFPTPLPDYFQQTFPDHEKLPARFHIFIRTVPLDSYLQHFHSDRSHMLSNEGKPLSPFPPYPPILVGKTTEKILLWDYLDMTRELNDGSSVYHCQSFFSEWLDLNF
ncbi:MAG: hypothetical protein HQM13_22730 [SAR324 cluster bacterium]|nr:hypothetical protein [SAR324 cluster bacterium]